MAFANMLWPVRSIHPQPESLVKPLSSPALQPQGDEDILAAGTWPVTPGLGRGRLDVGSDDDLKAPK
jgi:hypothetical protein